MTERRFLRDIFLREEKDTLIFGNTALKIRVSRSSGEWIGLEIGIGGGRFEASGPGVLLTVGGRMRHTPAILVNEIVGGRTIGGAFEYRGHEVICRDREVVLEVAAEEDGWILTSLYRLSPKGDDIRRDVRIARIGDGEELLRGARFSLPAFEADEAAPVVLEAPGYPVTPHFPLSEAPEGTWPGLSCRSFAGADGVSHAMDAPGSMTGLVALHDPEGEWSVMCWPFSVNEPFRAFVEKSGSKVVMGHRMELADRFSKGHVLEAGSQYIAAGRGRWRAVMERFHDSYDERLLPVSACIPSWAQGAAIYEVHVGRAPFRDGRDYEPYSSIRGVTEDLERIRGLGFGVIQLMPHWPFPGYSVDDFLDIDRTYGSEEQLRNLVETAHGMGLRVILDIVLHGCIDREIVEWDRSRYGSRHSLFDEWLETARERSPYRDEHPEWFQREEEGEIAKVYTWAFDPANRGFQDHLIEVARRYADRLRIDGFRFDAPTWNTFPNWDRSLPYRASASLYGAYELFRRMRALFTEEGRKLLLFTEPGGPLFRACMDLTYNYDEEWIAGSLMTIVSDRGYAGAGFSAGAGLDAGQLAYWLHYRKLALPPGAGTVHHLDSHDTFWWGGKAQFRREAFGRPAARVLFAFYALLGGGILVYTGAEKGEEAFYGSLLRLRQGTAVLRYGSCDSLAAGCDDSSVLVLLRRWRDDHALAMFNFDDGERNAVVRLDLARTGVDPASGLSVRDLLDEGFRRSVTETRRGAETTIPVSMDAFGVRILRLEPADGADEHGQHDE